MARLSKASTQVVKLISNQKIANAAKTRLRELENSLAAHRTASRELIIANEKGDVNGDHTDWEDIDRAIKFATKALGTEEVSVIRKNVRASYGIDDDEDEPPQD